VTGESISGEHLIEIELYYKLQLPLPVAFFLLAEKICPAIRGKRSRALIMGKSLRALPLKQTEMRKRGNPLIESTKNA